MATRAPSDQDRDRLLVWLAAGVAELEWALAQLPPERLAAAPPRHLSGWPALQHLWHLATYERTVALPSLEYLLTGDAAPLRRASQRGADAAYTGREDLRALLDDLAQVKAQERRLLEGASAEAWTTARPHPYYGAAVTARWMLQKSYQHTLEHLTAIWQMALFWDL
ncbi:MAG: DinB family protein [Chloroflexi bacterium]|nr:DinB family protein [Chloroflexota bacterium]